METSQVQNLLMDCLSALFRDPTEAVEYATDPRAYLDDRMGDVDYSQIHMRRVVDDAARQAEMPADMARDVQDSMFQPAPSIRVPVAREQYEYSRPDPTPGEYLDVKSPVQTPMQHADPMDMDRGHQTQIDHDRDMADESTHFPGRAVDHDPTPDYREAPPGEMPGHYEPLDGGGYHCPPATPDMHETYAPDNYTPDHIDADCVEYTVSNCVTTYYHDTPEVCEQLCHTRTYDDPYDRVDPAHSYPEVHEIIEREPPVNDWGAEPEHHQPEPEHMRDPHDNDHDRHEPEHHQPEPEHHQPEPEPEHHQPEPEHMRDPHDNDHDRHEPEPEHMRDPHDNGHDRHEPEPDDDYGSGEHHAPPPDAHMEPEPIHHEPEPVHHEAPTMDYQEPEHHEPEPIHHEPDPIHHEPEPAMHEPDPMDDDMSMDG